MNPLQTPCDTSSTKERGSRGPWEAQGALGGEAVDAWATAEAGERQTGLKETLRAKERVTNSRMGKV